MVDHRVVQALDALAGTGVTYADARFYIHEYSGHGIFDKDPRFQAYGMGGGLAVRVLKDNGWGHFAGPGDTPAFVAEQAVALAESSARINRNAPEIRLSSTPAYLREDHKSYTLVAHNPFSIPRATINEFLMGVCAHLDGSHVKTIDAMVEFYKTEKHYANTDGVRSEQDFTTVSGHLGVGGSYKGERHERTYEGFCLTAQGGWECVEGWKLPENAQRINRELYELMRSPKCPEGTMDLILDPSQLYLQVHENGHAFELDRILGYEIAFAGGSFIRPSDIGRLRFGSEKVNIIADASDEWGAGSFDFDDEGTLGQKIYLVKEGLIHNVLSSRETVMEARLPPYAKKSTGAMRAEGPVGAPLIRMTNVMLQEGNDGSIDDMIAATERGIVMATNRSWSIDDKRRNFQFGTEVGWLVENGKKTHMVRAPTYSGETISFWDSCDMVGDTAEILGVSNCGKGQPCQTMFCGHASPPARFRNVHVGLPVGSGGGCAVADTRRLSGQIMARKGVMTR